MSNWGLDKELQTWRKGRRLTQSDVANAIGMTRGGYANYEAGTAPVPDDKLKALRVLGFQSIRHDVGPFTVPASEIRIPLPYIGRIAASDPVDWTDPFLSEDFEYVPAEMGDVKGRFCCRVVGDSMFDLLWPDDLCVFQRSYEPKIGVVQLFVSHPEEGSTERLATIKVCAHNGTGFLLKPVNPAYATVPAKGDFYGYLVGFIREIGSRRVTVYDPTGIRP